MNRYVWDLRYSAPKAVRHTYPISALYESTHAEPQGPFVTPGKYEVRLTVDGQTYRQPLTVKLDPRVTVPQAALEQQLAMQERVAALISLSYEYHQSAAKVREEIAAREKPLENNEQAKPVLQALKDLDAKVTKIQGEQVRGFQGFGKPKPTFALVNSELATLSESVGMADAAPTAAMAAAYGDYCQDLTKLASQWSGFSQQDLVTMNSQLREAQAAPLAMPQTVAAVPSCVP
jgi:hypothetical protein